MAGCGDRRWILMASDGYVKRDGTITPNPNEAFHANVFFAGGRFAQPEEVIQSLCEVTKYSGTKTGLTYATFTNWRSEAAKRKNDIWSLREWGYNEKTYLTITEDDLTIRKK